MRWWVKTFYKNINSSVLYNGHCSSWLERRTGIARSRVQTPLKSWLFQASVRNCLNCVLNCDDHGLLEEFLLGQYADDTFFVLDGTQTSLSQCLDNLELFGECSGLKGNVEKAKAVWLGSMRFSKQTLLPEKNLAWVFNEPFDILGITFFVETQQIVEYNYRMKLDEVRKLLDSWSWRLLSIIGKIQVIKSLAISKFVHLFTTLPSPNGYFF